MTRPILALTLLFGLACMGSAPAPDEHDHDHDHGAPSEADPHEDHDDAVLEVDADVLRDLRVTTADARQGAADERAAVLGELAVDADRYAEVGAPGVARIRDWKVEPGQQVEAGDPIVELDSAELAHARAAYAAAEVRLATATRAVERKSSLTGGTVSAREAEDARSDLSVAQAEARAARAALGALGAGPSAEGGGTLILRSPVAGVVLGREGHRGAMVDTHDTLARVADLGALWLMVHAFERDALRVGVGGEVDVTLAALPNRVLRGRVTWVGSEVDVLSRTVPVRVVLDNPEGMLRPGMSATALLPLGGPGGGVTVPAGAVQRCDAGWCVFLPAGEGRYEVRPVGRGRDLAGVVELISGLQPGETVVVDGAFLLRAEAAKRAGGGDAHHH